MEPRGLNDKVNPSLTSTIRAIEIRLRAMTEERDQLSQLNIELFTVKAKYKGQLSRFDEIVMQHQIQEERIKMQRQIAMLQEDIRRKEEEHRAEVSGNNLFRWIFKKIKGVNSDFRNQGGQ